MSNNNWKIQYLPFDEGMQEALMQQHYAAQFLAKVGRHLIPQKADDSNTNMEFIPEENLLLGNALPNKIRLALNLSDLKLIILDNADSIKKTISLNGKTQREVFVELSQDLADLGVDVTNFKNELHYEIPFHPISKGAVFSIKNKNAFIENSNFRNNAKIVLNEITQLFTQEEPIRIWPHHFDTGAFFTVKKNEKGDPIQTIGIGFAIPDSMVAEPYYYLSFWSEKPIEGLDKFPPLANGKWMMPDWNGAILRNSDLLKAQTAQEQYQIAETFFETRINFLMKQLKE